MSRPGNLLALETSPYLLQHKDNPVHWRPWGADAFAEARAAGKPVLLSVGYAACHWCHVMAHESFEDPAIAGVMNELFVNVKVDREERPDVDAIYQAALAMLGEHGGWPLTMFLTPEGEPFWGGTYFPARGRYGRPPFPDVLRSVAETFANRRETVARNASALRDGLGKLAESRRGDGLDPARPDQVAQVAIRMVDPFQGGTLGAPKFPQPCFFAFLWRAYRRTGSRLLREGVLVTLDNLCQGGIYDHLGGGFARYATDPGWLVPHFEKMLYDNALLLDLLAEAWRETRSPLHEARARETVEWLLRDMRVGDGGDDGAFAFASAFDADSEGEEGRYYVWSRAEIAAVLGPAADEFCAVYGVTDGGNWEGTNILNRSRDLSLGEADRERRLADARARLLAARAKRVPPLRDDKVLADWNGLAIAALARAGAVFDAAAWVAAARRAFAFVATRMADGEGLRHSWRQGRARHPAVLDDYANMARAAVVLYQVSGDAAYLDRARAWVARADASYWDGERGGYFLSAAETTDLIARTKSAIDNAVPSGNGTLAGVLADLRDLTGEAAYGERAEALVRAFAGESAEHMANMPVLLMGFEQLVNPVQAVVVGDGRDPALAPLLRAAWQAPAPTATIARLAPDEDLPAGHPAHGKGLVDGRPAAYVCVGPVCGLPITEPGRLAEALRAA